MTRRDKWKQRPCVMKYYAFKDQVREAGLELPESGYHIIFCIPMTKSWSEIKKNKMRFTPHRQTPDKDNLEKALLDSLFKDDSHIWDGRVSKVWSNRGAIIVITGLDILYIGDFLHETKKI